MRLILKIIIFFVISSQLSTASVIDSLIQLSNNTSNDTVKISSLNKLAKHYIDINRDTAFLYADTALIYSKNNKFVYGEALSYKEYGIIYFYSGDFDNTIKYFNEALTKAIDANNTYLAANMHYLLGIAYYHKNKYDKALTEYNLALVISKEKNYNDIQANTLNAIGIIYKTQNNYIKAIEYYVKALKLAQKNNETEIIFNLYNNIGLLYKKQELYDKALEYYNEAIKLPIKNIDKTNIIKTYNNIGNIYKYKNKIDSATLYFNKALKIATTIKDNSLIYTSYLNFGNLYKKQKKYYKALDYYEKSINTLKTADDVEKTKVFQNLGEIYFLLQDSLDNNPNYLSQAIYYSEKAYVNAKKTEDTEVEAHALFILIQAYKKTNQTKKALDAAVEYIEISKKIYDTKKLEIVSSVEQKYNSEKNKILIEKLQKEQELRNQKIKTQLLKDKIKNRQFYVLTISILLLILFLIYAIIIIRKNRLLNHKLEKQQKQVKQEYLKSIQQNILIETKAKEIELQKNELSLKNKKMQELNNELETQKDQITQKNKTLQQIHDDYKKIFNSITDVIYMINMKGEFLFLNNPSKKFIGYSHEETINKSILSFIPESHQENYIANIKKGFSTGELINFESIVKHKEGFYIPVEITGKAIEFNGETVGVGSIRNITERKIAEQEIKDKTQKYELITNAIDDLIWMIDFNMKFLYVSPSSIKTIGFNEEELFKIELYRLFTKESLTKLRNLVAKAQINNCNQQISESLEYIHKNGDIIKANIVGHLVFEKDKAIGFVAVSRFYNKI